MSQPLDVEASQSVSGELHRDQAWRRERVSVAAYYLAEHRGFAPGAAASDWHAAEAQTDAVDEAGD